jgi:hypothetical protein
MADEPPWENILHAFVPARHEVIEWWVKVIGGFVTIFTGLLGVGIGLVAILKK